MGCGDRGRFVRNCPHTRRSFVAFRDLDIQTYQVVEDEPANPRLIAISTHGPGMAYLDCGATDSFAGESALEEYATAFSMLHPRHDQPALQYDFSDRPNYTFGDGETKTAKGRAELQIFVRPQLPGTLSVHSIPGASKVPILIGMSALTKLQLTADFESGACIFGSVDPDRVVVLPKSHHGHLMLDLLKPLSD